MPRARVAPLETSTLVEAPAEAVWDILKDQRRMRSWSYQLVAADGGTRLWLRRDLKNGHATWLSIIVATLALGGSKAHDVELLQGMDHTLAAIKQESESHVLTR